MLLLYGDLGLPHMLQRVIRQGAQKYLCTGLQYVQSLKELP